MVDFKAQLAKGLSAHQKALNAKHEVASTLRELSYQVSDFTNGAVHIAIRNADSPNIAERLAALAVGLQTSHPLNLQKAIVAYNPSGTNRDVYQLALWSQDAAGYPCTLRFDGTKRDVHDRASLERVLGELLASPETGKAIAALTNDPPNEDEDRNAPSL